MNTGFAMDKSKAEGKPQRSRPDGTDICCFAVLGFVVLMIISCVANLLAIMKALNGGIHAYSDLDSFEERLAVYGVDAGAATLGALEDNDAHIYADGDITWIFADFGKLSDARGAYIAIADGIASEFDIRTPFSNDMFVNGSEFYGGDKSTGACRIAYLANGAVIVAESDSGFEAVRDRCREILSIDC